MQNKIALDPNYKGPLIVEEFLRKMKSQSSLARMISTYNRRFFVLDFKRMIFYYLPEKGSQLSNAQDIPLDSITRIYLDAQLQLLDEGHHWKHGFVILCGKRSYKLISHSQNNMENLLYGFAHIINTETKRPLFDWDVYKCKKDAQRYDTEPQMPQEIQTFSPAIETPTPAVAQANPVVKKKSSQDSDSSDKGRQEIPEGPKVEEPVVVKKENSPQKNEGVPQGADIKKKKPLEQRNEEQNTPTQKLNVREVDSVDVCESQIIMNNESVHANASEPEQQVSSDPSNEGRRVEKNKIEIMSIDPVESSASNNNNNTPKSSRTVINRRLVHQDSPKNSGWGPSPKNEFAGQLKAHVHKSSEERYEARAETNNQPHSSGYAKGNSIKQQIGQDQDNDWDNVPVKKENVYKAQAKVEEVDDWDVESPPKKKNAAAAAKVQQQEDDDDWDKDMNYSPPKNSDKSRNVAKMQTSATKKADNDDDWDREMFDDHKPQNNRFEIRTEAKYTVQNSGYSSSAGGFGMPTRTVAVAKATVHNDWDDDL